MRQIVPRGPFSLRAAAEFGFGPNEGRAFDGTMRLAYPVDGGIGYAGAVLRQTEPDGTVTVELALAAGADADAALRQAARIVSLDHDGEAFLALGTRDPVLGRLQRSHPGQRPVLFHSPYEAAAWSIISLRRPPRQAAAVRSAIATALGNAFTLAGTELAAFPQPERLLELAEDFRGLNPTKVSRLHAIARGALEGELDIDRLHALGPEAAYDQVQKLPGIGPFYAGLIVLRASGFADAPLLMAEPRVMARAAELYDRPELGNDREQFNELAQAWRPFRIWSTVLIRLAGDRVAAAGDTLRR